MKPFIQVKSLCSYYFDLKAMIVAFLKKINDAFKFLRFQVTVKKNPRNAFACYSVLKHVHKFVLYIFLQFNFTHRKYVSLR
jgi:hypothetical protein